MANPNSDYAHFFPEARKTRLPGGYMGKILRVDLTTGKLSNLNLPEEPLLRKYWGGQLIAEYLLLNELPLDIDPYDPRNVIVGMTGPVTGTGFTPGGTKMCFVYLSPATRRTLGRGATSGYLGTAFKAAGYDGVIVSGAAASPKYLYIGEDTVELRDASHVWGKGIRDTENLLRKESGHLDARVGCIGPAGENLVRAAMLVNDRNHTAAHGLGAVMGSKMLKAFVAWGTKRPRIHDKQQLIEAGVRWAKALAPRKTTVKKRLTSVGHGEDWGAITKLNWRSTIITDEAKGLEQNHVTLRPCFQCPRMCPWDVEIGEGRHKGKIGHFNAGSEWMDTFYNLGFKGNDVLYLSERINDLGIECSHYACGAGLAFEAWEKGVLGPERTDGLKLEWGNLEAAETLLERCARRETWLGNILADGPKELAEELGGEAKHWVVHTKGGTPAQHEWRPLLSQMLRELVASGGMKPQGAGGTEPPADLRYREKWGPLDPNQPDGWPNSHLITEQIRQACGVMGACWFALNDKPPDGVQSMLDALNATTGWDVTIDELVDVGHRAIILQSLFGTQRGWVAEDDWQDVGPRFLEPIPDGKYQGFTIAKWLPGLVYEYYRISGRHEKTGRPYRDTLLRLGLDEFKHWSVLD
ncbi:MAG TPA: aldehyde ferredoxin oxidoreductase N-terminal domain-containing protein [Candidatus Binatia bacterium]|nr:aldehyde ferredoxin oxidoreductase N-terminal domain-containing protein [Candidatus Binatia bacterium]